MEIRKFKFEGTNARKWEYNLIGKKWNLRIANNQIGLWRNYRNLLQNPIAAYRYYLKHVKPFKEQ